MGQPTDDAKRRLGSTLRRARETSHLSVTAVARAVGRSRYSVYNWEKGDTWPDSPALLRLGELFHIRLDDLAGDGPQPRASSAFVANLGGQIEAFIDSEVQRLLDERWQDYLAAKLRAAPSREEFLAQVERDMQQHGVLDASNPEASQAERVPVHEPPRQSAGRPRGKHDR